MCCSQFVSADSVGLRYLAVHRASAGVWRWLGQSIPSSVKRQLARAGTAGLIPSDAEELDNLKGKRPAITKLWGKSVRKVFSRFLEEGDIGRPVFPEFGSHGSQHLLRKTKMDLARPGRPSFGSFGSIILVAHGNGMLQQPKKFRLQTVKTACLQVSGGRKSGRKRDSQFCG